VSPLDRIERFSDESDDFHVGVIATIFEC